MWSIEMSKFKFLIVLSVFQVSSSVLDGLYDDASNVTTTLNNQPSDGNAAYKLIAVAAAFLPSFVDLPVFDEESLLSDIRWQANRGFDAVKDVSFYLHTKSTSADQREELRLYDAQSLRASHYNAFHPTRIIIHGWLGSEYAGVFFSLTPAYLRSGNYNVILVDWGKGAIADYTTASRRVKEVGNVLAEFVDFLHRATGTGFENIYLIGFSMGAHIAGIAGKCVKNGRIAVIFGLDPALPLFSLKNTSGRLTSNDANYVEVIHTNAGGYGYEEAIGHADFYVNYGDQQPGCLFSACSHLRAFKIFAESIRSKIGFWGKGCDPRAVFDLLEHRKCYIPTGSSGLLGGDLSKKELRGVFYLTTNFKAPYAKKVQSCK